MAKPGKAAPEEAEAPVKPKSKRLLLAVVGVLILGAVIGAGWFLLKGSKHEEPKPVVIEQPVFMVLEPFTVNLQHEENDQFLQVGITLKVSSEALADKIRQRMPEARSRLLFLLSSKRPSELMPIEGKKKLAHEIAVEANTILGLREPSRKSAAHENGDSKAAASGVGAASSVNAVAVSAPAEEVSAASAPVEAAPMTHEGAEGVLDVLFTSFIIQ